MHVTSSQPSFPTDDDLVRLERGVLSTVEAKTLADYIRSVRPTSMLAGLDEATVNAILATEGPESWYLVEHFTFDEAIRQRHPLRSYVVRATRDDEALARVPEHPREWASSIRPVEMIEMRDGAT